MSDSDSTSAKPHRWLVDVAFAMCVLGAIGGLVWYLTRPRPLPEGISRLEYERAEHRLRRMNVDSPTPEAVFFSMGEKQQQDEDFEKALKSFGQIPSDDSEWGLSARLREGEIYVKLNRAEEAENRLEQCLKIAERRERPPLEQLKTAYEWLNFLLSVELRFEERKEYLNELHELGQASLFASKQLYFPHLLIWRSSTGRKRLQDFLQEDPRNVRLLIAKGRYLTAAGKLNEAVAHLEDTRRKHPNNLYAAAALLECYYERSDEAEFAQVARSLPEFEPEEPWLLTQMRGYVAFQDERAADAERCFQHILSVDPANPEAQMGLARAYEKLGKTDARRKALERSQVLAEIRVFLSNVTDRDPKASLELADLCESIELNAAARTFREHSKRISRLLERASANLYFVE